VRDYEIPDDFDMGDNGFAVIGGCFFGRL